MKQLNEYFSVSNDADYTFKNKIQLTLRAGRAIVWAGGIAEVRESGYAEVRESGYAEVREGGYAEVREGGYAYVWWGGSAGVMDGGRATVFSGGTADVWDGGHATVRDGGIANVMKGGLKTTDRVAPNNLAKADGYILRTCQGLFQAGCSMWLTRDEALKRWDREDDRACIFTLAILSCDWGNTRTATSRNSLT